MRVLSLAMFNRGWAKMLVFAGLTVAAAVAPGLRASAKEGNGLSLGLIPVVDNLPFHVSQEKGLFGKFGLDVRLVPFTSAMERDTALRTGAIDGCITDIVAAALLEGTGADISIISLGLGASPAEGRFALLAPPGSHIKTAKQLKGIPIGVSKNSIIEYVADELLLRAGLKPKEVVKTEVSKIPVRLEMLLSGKLKAAVLPDPMASYAISKGAGLILDDTKVNLSQTVLLFRKESVKKKPSVVKSLLKAYGEAAGIINENPEKYRDLLADTANLPDEVRKTYPIDHYPPPQVPGKSDVDRILRWMKKNRLVTNGIEYGDLVDSSFVSVKNR